MSNEMLTITVPQVLKVHPSQVEGDTSGVIQNEVFLGENGGAYLREEEREALKKGARVFFIDGNSRSLIVYPEPRILENQSAS